MSSLPLADPAGASALVAAVAWLQETLLGTVATTIAVISIASVGLGMLTGRVDMRRGATVIIGCFILFGASGIVAGLQAASAATGLADTGYVLPQPVQPPAPAATFAAPAKPYDPYAGASVP